MQNSAVNQALSVEKSECVFMVAELPDSREFHTRELSFGIWFRGHRAEIFSFDFWC